MRTKIPTRLAPLTLVLACLAPIAAVQEQRPPADPLAERAAQVAALFVEKPELPDGLFHASFLEQVPAFRMIGILKSYRRQGGACVAHEPVSRESTWSGRFRLLFEEQREATLTLTVEPVEPHAVVGLFLSHVEPTLTSFDDLAAALNELPGRAGCAVLRLGEGEPEPLFGHRADESFAIGSTFKLYVLGALVTAIEADERAWSDVVELRERWRSLPSGALSKWPAGTPFTLAALAGLMISQSDNTATDHLLFTLGRERVEGLLAEMGQAAPERNRPFLSTGELFRLKGVDGGAHGTAYLALEDAGARRAFLDGALSEVPLESVSIGSITLPNRLDELEWFASCADLCRAMDWLRRRTAEGAASHARELLAISGGLPAADRFAYAGYKGGSEGGVLNLTWLLRREDGEWLAFSASWNDPAKALDEARFFGLVGRALGLVAAAELPAAR